MAQLLLKAKDGLADNGISLVIIKIQNTELGFIAARTLNASHATT